MVLLDNDVYREAKNIALGIAHRNPLANDFAAWAASEYAIRILNVQLQKLEPPSRFSYRLLVNITNTEDYQKTLLSPWERNDQLLAEMARQFLALAAKHGSAERILITDLLVTCYDFSHEAMTEANWKATEEFRAEIRRPYPIIWDVMALFESSVVFYFSDEDIFRYLESGVSQTVTDEYYSILKKHDDLSLFTKDNLRLSFDSKENVDKNYAGSLFYYSRG